MYIKTNDSKFYQLNIIPCLFLVNVLHHRIPLLKKEFLGGSSNQVTNVPMENFIHYLNQEGLVYYDWNISLSDIVENDAAVDEIVAKVTEDVVKYKTSVILMHDADDMAISAEALTAVIDALLDLGVEILPIDENTAVIQDIKAATIE